MRRRTTLVFEPIFRSTPLSASEQHTMLAFRVAGMICALPLAEVGEVTCWATLSPALELPEFVRGFLNLRGALLPVLSLERLFGRPSEPESPEHRILVLKTMPRRIGIAVSQPTEIRVLPAPAIQPHRGGIGGAILGQTLLDGTAVQVLSASKILLAQEQAWLAGYAARQADRLRACAEPE